MDKDKLVEYNGDLCVKACEVYRQTINASPKNTATNKYDKIAFDIKQHYEALLKVYEFVYNEYDSEKYPDIEKEDIEEEDIEEED